MRRSSRRLRFLLASGPTREPLDPVRYLSNYSTGTMGRHLARAVRRRGHRLTWVRSPEDAETARELLRRLVRELPRHDVLVMATAVCDVRPMGVSRLKIKKRSLRSIRLRPNPDILRELARRKKAGQVFVGFALESENIRRNALEKLRKKKLELILAQRVTTQSTPFGEGRLDATAYGRTGPEVRFSRVPKARIAARLVREAERLAAENCK